MTNFWVFLINTVDNLFGKQIACTRFPVDGRRTPRRGPRRLSNAITLILPCPGILPWRERESSSARGRRRVRALASKSNPQRSSFWMPA